MYACSIKCASPSVLFHIYYVTKILLFRLYYCKYFLNHLSCIELTDNDNNNNNNNNNKNKNNNIIIIISLFTVGHFSSNGGNLSQPKIKYTLL